MTHIEYLTLLNACDEAIEYAKNYNTLQEAWDSCDRGDWMLWLLSKQSGEPETNSRKKLVLCACKCARLSLKYVPDGELRPLQAIETAEKYARNEDGITTIKNVKNAAANASASASAASASAYAADYANAANAAYAATASASDYAYAASAAYAAASNAASNAASASAYANAAYTAAKNRILAECAEIVREMYPEIQIIE